MLAFAERMQKKGRKLNESVSIVENATHSSDFASLAKMFSVCVFVYFVFFCVLKSTIGREQCVGKISLIV